MIILSGEVRISNCEFRIANISDSIRNSKFAIPGLPVSFRGSSRTREDREKLASFLKEPSAFGLITNTRLVAQFEPILSLRRFLFDYANLVNEIVSRLSTVCFTIIRTNRSARFQQLIADNIAFFAFRKSSHKLNDSKREMFCPPFETFLVSHVKNCGFRIANCEFGEKNFELRNLSSISKFEIRNSKFPSLLPLSLLVPVARVVPIVIIVVRVVAFTVQVDIIQHHPEDLCADT